MKKLFAILLTLCLLSTAALASMPESEENFYLYDGANVISYEAEGVIFYNNEALEKACGAQIVIATVKNTGSKTTERYAYELFNKWEVGDKKKDNGFLLLMTIEDDDYYLCEGTGAERIINAGELKLMLNEYLEPDFAKKKYSDGAVKIFEAVFEAVRDHYGINLAFMDEEALQRTGKLGGTAEWESAPSNRAPNADKDSGGDTFATILGAIIVIAIIVAIVSRPRRRGAVINPGPTVIVTPSRRPRVFGSTRSYRPRSGSFGGWSSGSSRSSSSGSSFRSSSGAGRSSFSSGSRGGFSGGRGGGGSSRGGGAGRGR